MTTTYAPTHNTDDASETKGFLSRFFAWLIVARQMEADRLVRQHLLTYTDKELSAVGFSRKDLLTKKPLHSC